MSKSKGSVHIVIEGETKVTFFEESGEVRAESKDQAVSFSWQMLLDLLCQAGLRVYSQNSLSKPQVWVDPDGRLHLKLDLSPESRPAKAPSAPPNQRLPLLAALRKEAQALKVDISHLGTKRRAIFNLLEETKAQDPGPMSADPDEVRVSEPTPSPKEVSKPKEPAESPKPLRGFMRTGSPVPAKVVPNLQEVLSSIQGQDLRDLFDD